MSMKNSVDLDHLASLEVYWDVSKLFSKEGIGFWSLILVSTSRDKILKYSTCIFLVALKGGYGNSICTDMV